MGRRGSERRAEGGHLIDDILAKLDKVRRTGAHNWIACCPAHDDKSPSMTLHAVDDGRILVKCFSGCSFEEIVNAVGLGWDPWFPPKPRTDFVVPIRRPFPAADVLESVAEETMIVAVAAYRLATELPLLDSDKERLMLAYHRLAAAHRQALGNTLEEKRRG